MRYTIEKAKNSMSPWPPCATEPYRPTGELSADCGREGMIAMITADSVAREGCGAVRWGQGEARHQPHLFRGPFQPRGAVVLRHGHISRRGGQDQCRHRAWRASAGGLADRRRWQPSTDPRVLRPAERCCLWGDRGLQRLRPCRDRGNSFGLFTGLGFGIDPKGRHNDGCFIAVFNVRRSATWTRSRRSHGVRTIPEGYPESTGLYRGALPGRDRIHREQDRRKNGMPVEDATWKRLSEWPRVMVSPKIGV